MNHCNRNTFEKLPNEVLLELFEYVEIQDLFYGFWGLNRRLNQTIASLRNLSLNLDQYEPTLISLFAKQINRLVVNTWQDISLGEFPCLQSLILHQVTGNQLRQIRSEIMPNLIYLSTSSIPEFTLMPQLAQRVFSNEMPTVRSVDLGDVHVPYQRRWSQSPSLHSVSISSTNPTIIPFILSSSPNLVHLSVHFLANTVAIFDNGLSIQNHPLKRLSLLDPYHKLSFNHVYTILAFTPNVSRIRLNFSCKVPFSRLLNSLLSRLQCLKYFDCNIDDRSNEKLTDVEILRQIHPCFSRIQCSVGEPNLRIFSTE